MFHSPAVVPNVGVMKSIRTLLGFAVASSTFAADVIPASRRYTATVGDSVGYGVPGGIWQYRNRTVINVTGLDPTGVNDASAIIQAAIDAAAENTCVKLPAGTFRLNNGINVGIRSDRTAAKRNITLRGAGMGQTILKTYGGAAVSMSGGGGFPTYFPSAAYLTADTPAGSTTIQISESVADSAGLHCVIEGYHDPAVPLVSVGGTGDVRPTYLRLTGASGNTATFFPPLPFPLKAGAKFTRETGTGAPHYVIHTNGIGLEDLTVDGANSTSQITIGMFSTRHSWIYNVEVKNVQNYGINAAFNLQSSIIHCKVHTHIDSYPSYTSRNLILIGASTLMLVEDNIIANGFSAFELNAGVILSAFSHNFCDRIGIRDTIASVFNINHGPHNSFNTYEGNIAARIQSDGYFGSSSDEMLHRNWFHGTNGVHTTDWATSTPVTNNRLPITLNRFAHNFNLVGNLIGRTGTGITWAYTNVGPGFTSTSTTNANPTIGSEPAFTIGTGLSYNNNGTVAILYSASNPSRWVLGSVRNYNPSTGTMYLENVKRVGGSGPANDWIVVGGGGYGSNTIYALGGPNIGGGGLWFGQGGIVAPNTRGIWWPAWDGSRMNQRGAFNSSTVYNMNGSGPTGQSDVVNHYANGPTAFNGGNAITSWIAANPAKSGTATWATPGPNQTDWLPLGSNGYQELDYDVYGTAILKDNWNAATNGIHSAESLGSDTYPVSRIRSGSARPNFFGTSLTYPAFDSHAPNQSFSAIPAGYRYLNNGAEVPGYNPDDAVGPPVNRSPTFTSQGATVSP